MRPPSLILPLLTLLPHLTLSHPAFQAPLSPSSSDSDPIRPLIIWHGLGDTYTSPGLRRLSEIYTTLLPSSPVHIISLDPSSSTDRQLTFLGYLPDQLSSVCDQLLSLPTPFSSHRLNFLGLSQGSQFLRALIQSCPLPLPPRTLVTLGGQHNGIIQFLPGCKPTDWICKSTTSLLNNNKWSTWSQTNLVPAQYFRDPLDLPTYLSSSSFLAPFNNEIPESRNKTYAQRLRKLDTFVMYVFEDDQTVIPKESGWFDDVNPESGEVTKLRDRDLYNEDWLGLKALDKKGGLKFETIPGRHMELPDDIVTDIFRVWFASDDSGTSPPPVDEK